MKKRLFLIGALALIVASTVHAQGQAGLVGTWRLVTYEDHPDQGPARFP
jgi:hypothetical protein